MEEERRYYVRIPAHLTVSYSVFPQGKRSPAMTRDLSAGGLRLAVSEPLSVGTLLHLELTLPNVRAIPFQGEIRWSDQDRVSRTTGRQDSYEIGVRIVQILPADREALKQYVSSHV
jgi:c-di-GMP-binding flagellar brake protein YcgR